MAANSEWENSIKLGDGHRMTPQRREVYEVLMEHQDHPTATEVFMRVKERMPAISLATVYNCLDTLSGAGCIIQVNVDREPSRYCGNLSPHGHFHCEACGTVLDVQLKEGAEAARRRLSCRAVPSWNVLKSPCEGIARSVSASASRSRHKPPNNSNQN